MKKRPLLWRIPIFLIAAILFALIPDGLIVFYLGALLIVSTLAVSLLTLDGFLRIDLAFMLGFLLIVCGEGIFSGPDIAAFVGADQFSVAARVLVCGALVLLVGHDITYTENNGKGFRYPVERVRLASPLVRKYMLALFVLISLAYVPFILYGFTQGRFAGFSAASKLFASVFPLGIGALLGHLAMSGGLVFPSMVAYYFRFIARVRYPLVYAVVFSAPVFIGLVATGTRARILLAFIGFTLVFIAGHRLRFERMFKISALGGLVFVAAILMYDARSRGWQNIDVQAILTSGEKYAAFFNENVVLTMTKIDDLYRFREREFGRSTQFYFIFWFPRIFWYDKPVALENWWWKEYEPDIERRSGHAASTSFAGPFFADFGAFGAMVPLFVVGLGFGWLGSLFNRRMRHPGDPLTPFFAVLFPASVFFARQVGTIYFWSVYMFILCFGIQLVVWWKTKSTRRL